MSLAPAAAIAVALLAAPTAPARAVPAAATGEAATPSERLLVTGPAWSIEGLPLRISVETRGALAERAVGLLVFVDDRLAAEAKTAGNRTRIEVPAAALGSGRRRILVKTGSERSWVDVRILPRAGLWTGGALLMGAAAAAAIARRRRAPAVG